MRYFFPTLCIILAASIEATLVALPITLLCVLAIETVLGDDSVFLFALLAGIVVDSLAFRHIGVSSLFFVGFLGMIVAYRKKFETKSLAFIVSVGVLGSILYSVFFGERIAFAVITSLVFSLGFFFLTQFFPKKIAPEKDL